MKLRFSLSIGTKIFGVATSMLTLLLGVTCLNYIRIRQVNHELIDIAHYLAPLTENLAEINVHVLEQEIHFERMFRSYENVIVDIAQTNSEQQACHVCTLHPEQQHQFLAQCCCIATTFLLGLCVPLWALTGSMACGEVTTVQC